MISSVSSNSMMPPHSSNFSSSKSSSSLTSSQLETISSVLKNYDPSNLTSSDAQSIIASFEEAGIQPSLELASAMEELGFNAQEVGNLGKSSSHSGSMPPPPSSEEVSSISTLLDSILGSDEEDETSTTSFTSTSDIMDYTSRILSLNDRSKEKVIELLEKYSSEESEYSQSEKNTLLKASLSEILTDNNNYKSVSFYG